MNIEIYKVSIKVMIFFESQDEFRSQKTSHLAVQLALNK